MPPDATSTSQRGKLLKNAMDHSSAICDADMRLIAQGLTLPLHLGHCPTPWMRSAHASETQFGLATCTSSTTRMRAAPHLPDIFLIQPVFHSEQLLGFVCAIWTPQRYRWRIAGGNACDSTEIYQEGLRIPPLRLLDRGEVNDDSCAYLSATSGVVCSSGGVRSRSRLSRTTLASDGTLRTRSASGPLSIGPVGGCGRMGRRPPHGIGAELASSAIATNAATSPATRRTTRATGRRPVDAACAAAN
jgi:N-methylhydantoinase B